MRLWSEKEIPAATSGCRLTIGHWRGESEALFPPPQIPQCGVSGCPSSDEDWVHLTVAGRGYGQDLGLILSLLSSGGGKGASSWDKEHLLTSQGGWGQAELFGE